MTIEFIGMIHHRHASEIHPPANLVLDRGYIRAIDYGRELLPLTRQLIAQRAATQVAA
jgi:hypothetical protein